ncbi:MAG: hypothetical protein ACRERS_01575 [Methylococcales bacterium]
MIRKKSLAVLAASILGINASLLSPHVRAVQTGNYSVVDNRPNIIAMGLDFLVVRPLTFGITVGGGVFWFLTLPVSALGGNAREAGETFFIEPARYTFLRPLGKMQLEPSRTLAGGER